MKRKLAEQAARIRTLEADREKRRKESEKRDKEAAAKVEQYKRDVAKLEECRTARGGELVKMHSEKELRDKLITSLKKEKELIQKKPLEEVSLISNFNFSLLEKTAVKLLPVF